MNKKTGNNGWDPYSEQPYKLPSDQKPRTDTTNLIEYSKVFITALLLTPAIGWRYFKPKRQTPRPDRQHFVGLSISPNSMFNNALLEMVDELGVAQLLLRMPSWQMNELEPRVRFAEQFGDRGWVINVLQNRDSFLDGERWQQNLARIFSAFQHLTPYFQIGNAINRSKWGCRHSGEFLTLMELAAEVQRDYPKIRLIGSSVIDFEPLVTLRTLFNFYHYQQQHTASLLYINRRGSAFGKQYRYFDLERKIRLIAAINALSNRSDNSLWITEFNWPLLNTRPYTPNSGHPRSTVDEATQARYLKQYYQIAWRSGLVERVYWWQLLNPGYGLVNFRDGTLRKHPSWFAFKEILAGDLKDEPDYRR